MKAKALGKAVFFLGVGAAIGTVIGYVNQCAGGSCPLMCVWWRGAAFGALAGLAIYFSGASGSTPPKAKDPD